MEEEKRVSSDAPGEPAKKTADAESAAQGAPAGMREMEALASEVQTLRGQMEEINDRNLRLVAEMENLRRRTERDKSEFAKYAISEFARDVLTVGDNVRRAIEAVPKEAVLSHPALSVLIEGVEMTERDLIKVLERYQVKRFDPLGEPFNPHLHEAMTKVDVPNVPADTVIQTIHAGYMIGDRILRPAAVIVAKGGSVAEVPKPTAPGEGGEPLPPGAMRVPDDAVSSAAPRQGQGGEPRRQGEENWRQGQGRPDSPDDRVAAMRRQPQQRQGGGGPYTGRPPQQPGNQGQQGQGQGNTNPNRSSTLHKPVIGGGGGPNSKPDW